MSETTGRPGRVIPDRPARGTAQPRSSSAIPAGLYRFPVTVPCPKVWSSRNWSQEARRTDSAGQVLAQPGPPGRAEDRHDVGSLAEQPGERDLRRGGTHPLGEPLAAWRPGPCSGRSFRPAVGGCCGESRWPAGLRPGPACRSGTRGRAGSRARLRSRVPDRAGGSPASMPRSQREYSDCNTLIGWVACARRMVAALASDKPR